MKKPIKKQMKKYLALSLIEMLITIAIISTVMLLCGVILNTLIRVSSISEARTSARQESEFLLEYLKKSIRNSETTEIFLYAPTGRAYDAKNDQVVDVGGVTGYDTALTTGVAGTEIHFRPIGYKSWVCLGVFKDKDNPNLGYIVKTTASDLTKAADCFDNTRPDYKLNTFVLNSTDIDVDQLNMTYNPTFGANYIITIDLTMEPIHWVNDNAEGLKPTYFKQAIISTQRLSWE